MKKIILSFLLCSLVSIGLTAQSLTASITTVPCNNDGVCSVTVTGLTAPISYTYYLGGNVTVVHSNINSLTDLVSNFDAEVQSGIGIYASDGINTVYGNAPYSLPFSYWANNIPALCPSTTGTLSASVNGGVGPFSYTWTNKNTAVVYIGNNIPAPIGDYSLSVSDQGGAGCIVNMTYSVQPVYQYSNINAAYSVSPANCTDGIASAVASGGVAPYTYLWNNGSTSSSITNLVMGNYTVLVTDAQGCTNNYQWGSATVSQAVTINVTPSITNATCIQSNGSAIAFATGGVGPYTYLWSNGQTNQTLSSVTGGVSYQVIATDANNCIGQGIAYVGVTTPISVTYTASPSSCIAPTGSATLTISGGMAPYTTVWNTYPTSATGITVSGLSFGQYGFTVTDAVGCIQTGVAYIPPISNIFSNQYVTPVVCPATTGTISIYGGGTNPPFTYSWSNGATTSVISNVPVGYYTCVITDAVGCSITKSVNSFVSSPITVGITSVDASCIFAADGSVIANANGGTSPYVYQWSNGQVGATASGLLTGNVWVNVTDANGCTSSNYVFVGYNAANNSCYCTISGKVYKDGNSNCTIDVGETGIQNIMIHCSGIGYTFTDGNGNYSFQVPSGTYTLSESVNSTYPLASCQNNAIVQTVIASAGCTSTVNFANNVIILHDLHIITTSYPYSAPIPGNPYNQRVIIENNGTIQESGVQIGYTNDGQLGTLSANPSLFTQLDAVNYPNWYSEQSGFTSLAPGTSDEINLTYNTPTNVPLGTLVNFYDSTAHAAPINTVWLTDQTPWNNVQNYQQTVISSFDPNFKEVSPKGYSAQGYIQTKDSVLNYIIHFQNEGTYFAHNISVLDTLDSDLDWSTLHPGYSDHNYTTTVSETGVITFKFANINLPWKSQYGDIMSSGMIAYSIKRKNNLAQGTQFKNKAAIYFDYNTPIITNSTINTLNDVVTSVDENHTVDNSDVVLYPNPAADKLSIAINAKESTKGQVNVLDITGKVLSSQIINLETGKNIIHENTSSLPSGVYFVQVKYNESFITKKLVVIK